MSRQFLIRRNTVKYHRAKFHGNRLHRRRDICSVCMRVNIALKWTVLKKVANKCINITNVSTHQQTHTDHTGVQLQQSDKAIQVIYYQS